MDHASLLKQFEHLDPHNQNTFEAKDLELLISTVRSCMCASDPNPGLLIQILGYLTRILGYLTRILGYLTQILGF